MPSHASRALPMPSPAEATTEQVIEEYGQAAELLQQAAQEASMAGVSDDSSNLHIAAGIMTDRWRDLRNAEVPAITHYQPSSLYCECHTGPTRFSRARKLLTEWHVKALLACRQMVAAVHERTSGERGAATGSRNVRNWANSAGVSVQKIILYAHDVVSASSSSMTMHAHRAEMVQVMERLQVAKLTIEAMKRHG